MLVLTRKPLEKIVLTGGIEITFVGGGPGHARIGIEAPRHIEILREELVSRENRARLFGPAAAPTQP